MAGPEQCLPAGATADDVCPILQESYEEILEESGKLCALVTDGLGDQRGKRYDCDSILEWVATKPESPETRDPVSQVKQCADRASSTWTVVWDPSRPRLGGPPQARRQQSAPQQPQRRPAPLQRTMSWGVAASRAQDVRDSLVTGVDGLGAPSSATSRWWLDHSPSNPADLTARLMGRTVRLSTKAPRAELVPLEAWTADGLALAVLQVDAQAVGGLSSFRSFLDGVSLPLQEQQRNFDALRLTLLNTKNTFRGTLSHPKFMEHLGTWQYETGVGTSTVSWFVTNDRRRVRFCVELRPSAPNRYAIFFYLQQGDEPHLMGDFRDIMGDFRRPPGVSRGSEGHPASLLIGTLRTHARGLLSPSVFTIQLDGDMGVRYEELQGSLKYGEWPLFRIEGAGFAAQDNAAQAWARMASHVVVTTDV